MDEEVLPKVLIVEDDRMLQKALALRLGGKATVLSAHTLAEARELFVDNPDIGVVVLDGCLRSAFQAQTPDTLPLIPEIRKTFCGPIIAASSIPRFRQMMMEIGCDHDCEEKRELPRQICRLLEERVNPGKEAS